MSRETRDKLSDLGDALFETERREKDSLYRRMAEEIVSKSSRDAGRKRRRTALKVVLMAACFTFALFLGAVLLSDAPPVRAVRSAMDRAREVLSGPPGVSSFGSTEELERHTGLTLPRLTYLPEGFSLAQDIHYQEYDGAPIVNMTFMKGDEYLGVIVEGSGYQNRPYDLYSYDVIEDAGDKVCLLSQTPPYAGEAYIGDYAIQIISSLPKAEMEKILRGVERPSS